MASRTALDIIIVGAGFGGLSGAIELKKRGHNVHVYELAKDLTRQGDVIMMGSNATRILQRWGNVLERQLEIASQPEFLKIQDKAGKELLLQPIPKEFDGFPNIYTSRTKLQNIIYDHAKEIGVEFTFNARINEYFEDEVSQKAGIVYNGDKITADVVLGADSVHSKARAYVLGKQQPAQKSGFATYRSWFSLDYLSNNPLTRSIADSQDDLFQIWIAEDIHAILTTNVKMKTCTCFVTHKDHSDIEESWHLPGKVDDMLAIVDESWDPIIRQIIRSIPPETLIDHKLLWRDPVPQWVSTGGRVALLGDAAHPHLPTAGTGGAQAIEDGATIGVILGNANREDIPVALRAYQRLRSERTALTQRMGWETRHRWHQTDWESVAKNKDLLKLPQPVWLNAHDAEDYASQNADAVFSHIKNGTPFESTNLPEGYKHEDWTIETMLSKEGVKVDSNFYKVKNN